MNTACDVEIYGNLFQIIIAAAQNLTAAGYEATVNQTTLSAVKAALPKLIPITLFYRQYNGTSLKEWYNEFPSVDEHHCHASHLIHTFPLHFTGFGKYTTSDLYNVSSVSWWNRGGPSNLWHPDGTTSGVRLGLASDALTNQKHRVFNAYGTEYYQYGPVPASVGEAIIDSTNNEIAILPYIPQQWSSGSVAGLRARGGYDVSIT